MSVGIFTWLLQYFPKNRAILIQKLWCEKKLSKSVFGYFKTKKKFKKKFRWPLSSRGGGDCTGDWVAIIYTPVRPLCSRASLLTGKYLHNTGAINNTVQGNCGGQVDTRRSKNSSPLAVQRGYSRTCSKTQLSSPQT